MRFGDNAARGSAVRLSMPFCAVRRRSGSERFGSAVPIRFGSLPEDLRGFWTADIHGL